MPYIPPPGQVDHIGGEAEISPPQPPAKPPRKRRGGWTLRLTPAGFALLIAINLVSLGGLAYGMSQALNWSIHQESAGGTQISEAVGDLSATPALSGERTPTATLPRLTSTTTLSPDTPTPFSVTDLEQGLILLALDDGAYTHLFAYQPQESGSGQPLPLARLTSGPWDDITPALSPDGLQVAFASNRNGYWDLYLLDLPSGQLTRLTDTLAYEAAPSWSPDGQWLAYEAYQNDNLDIRIQSTSDPNEIIPLTEHMASDHSPAWSPGGRQIAFVSTRSGEPEIWLADLDKPEDQRFIDISQTPLGADRHPAWSPDGTLLAWSSDLEGVKTLLVQEINWPAGPGTPVAGGRRWTAGSASGGKTRPGVRAG
jgi:TolB protein